MEYRESYLIASNFSGRNISAKGDKETLEYIAENIQDEAIFCNWFQYQLMRYSLPYLAMHPIWIVLSPAD